jgi:hypothetical protein
MDQMQFARKRHASASRRRTSIPVEYRSSSGRLPLVADIFRTIKMPEFKPAIESKIFALFA